jgi:hypothetical protein
LHVPAGHHKATVTVCIISAMTEMSHAVFLRSSEHALWPEDWHASRYVMLQVRPVQCLRVVQLQVATAFWATWAIRLSSS